MMRLLLILLTFPAIASAETRVRTAEHGTFTRVVIDYVNRPDYDLVVGEGEVLIQTDEFMSYDLSDVYRRIERTRVTRFTQRDDALVIDLGCNCTARQTELPTGGLVIDILDPDLTARMAIGDDLDLDPTSQQEQSMAARMDSSGNFPASQITIPGLLTRKTAEASPMAQSLRDTLIADLFDNSLSGVSLKSRVERPIVADTVSGVGAETISAGQIGVDTRRAQDARGNRRIPALASCAPVLLQSIPDWLDGPENLEAATGNVEILAATAKRLILRGFGAEASAILDSALDIPDKTVLLELAQLVDAPVAAPLTVAMSECSDLAILFAALADPPTPPARPGALVAAIGSLPLELRDFYGDRIINQMQRIGQVETVELVQAAVGRRDLGQAVRGADPYDDIPSGESSDSAALETEIARRTPDAGPAMTALIRGYIDRFEPIPRDIFEQAAIMLRETEGDVRLELERTLVAARIAERDVRNADRIIAAIAERLPEEADSLRQLLAGSIMEYPSDADFLRSLALVADEPLVDDDLRVQLADRALQLEMPHLAVAVLTANPGVPSRSENLLLARAYLDRREWAKATVILDQMTGADANLLRTRLPASVAPAQVMNAVEPTESAPPTIRTRSTQLVAETESLRAEWSAFLEQ